MVVRLTIASTAEAVRPPRIPDRRRRDAAVRRAGEAPLAAFRGRAAPRRLPVYARQSRPAIPPPTAWCSGRALRRGRSTAAACPSHPIAVQWQVATDEQMQIASCSAARRSPLPELGHSVHVEVDGLEPSRWDWYQFKVGNEVQPDRPHAHGSGAPASIEDLRFAFVSCQHYAQGFYYAYRHLAAGRPRLRRAPRRLHLRGPLDEHDPAARICPRTRSHRSTTIGSASRSTSPIRICRPRTPRSRGSSPGTITRPRTTTPVHPGESRPTRQTISPTSPRAARAPTRRITSTCRCAPRSCRSGPRCSSIGGCSSAICCRSTCSTRGSIGPHRAPAPCLPTERESTATVRARSIRHGRSKVKRSRPGCSTALADRPPAGTCWRTRCRSRPTTPTPIRRFAPLAARSGTAIRSTARRCSTSSASAVSTNTVVITGDVHQNFVRNVPPDYVRLDAHPIATEFIGTSITHRRRPHAHHGPRRKRQQSAPALPGQPPRLCALHGVADLWRADYRVVPVGRAGRRWRHQHARVVRRPAIAAGCSGGLSVETCGRP